MKKSGTQARRWLLTINNPQEHGITEQILESTLSSMKSLSYYCYSLEVGAENKTEHYHIFLISKSGLRFSTIKNKFPAAHVDKCLGTNAEVRDYVFKTGKWASDEKADTKVPDTQHEWGELPESKQGYRSDIAQLYQLIADGFSNAEIMAQNPDFAVHINKMDKIRQEILEDQYRNIFRNLEVTYIWGATETGKTRGVLEKHGYSNVYRVTDYKHPFDRYNSEHVICFEEYRNSLLLSDMLSYLDGYPINLPARYSNKVACYEIVYIISNIDLKKQYPLLQQEEPESWKAFLRRINKVLEYKADGSIVDHGTAMEYIFPPEPEWVKDAEQATLVELLEDTENDDDNDLPF